MSRLVVQHPRLADPAVAAFADAVVRGDAVTIFGDGRQTRDFVPVANVVQCLIRAAAWDGAADGRAFNVGMGRAETIRDVATMMAAAAGAADAPRFAAERPGDVRHSCADVSAARRELGYEPLVSLEQGLSETIAWYRGQIG